MNTAAKLAIGFVSLLQRIFLVLEDGRCSSDRDPMALRTSKLTPEVRGGDPRTGRQNQGL